MAERPVILVRYCGGCNPRYDRVKAVQMLEKQYPQISFQLNAPDPLALLLVCGCPSRCICEEYEGQGQEVLVMAGNEDREPVAKAIEQLLKKW